MSGVFQVTDRTFDEEIIQSAIPVLVDFWADWCLPCKAMATIVEELALKYRQKIKFAQMDVVSNHEVPARFGIRSLPTLILFRKGTVVHTIFGSFSKSLLEEALRKLS